MAISSVLRLLLQLATRRARRLDSILPRLPPELLGLIASHIHDTPTLHALSLTSQYFHVIFTPYLWKRIVVNTVLHPPRYLSDRERLPSPPDGLPNPKRLEKIITRLCRSTHLGHVRTLQIRRYGGQTSKFDNAWMLVQRLSAFNLTALELTNVRVANTHLDALRALTNLRALFLERTRLVPQPSSIAKITLQIQCVRVHDWDGMSWLYALDLSAAREIEIRDTCPWDDSSQGSAPPPLDAPSLRRLTVPDYALADPAIAQLLRSAQALRALFVHGMKRAVIVTPFEQSLSGPHLEHLEEFGGEHHCLLAGARYPRLREAYLWEHPYGVMDVPACIKALDVSAPQLRMLRLDVYAFKDADALRAVMEHQYLERLIVWIRDARPAFSSRRVSKIDNYCVLWRKS